MKKRERIKALERELKALEARVFDLDERCCQQARHIIHLGRLYEKVRNQHGALEHRLRMFNPFYL
ncbi:MAG: hypothetical protein GY871_04495 [Actinomycetales bacterium]|nr:hypothetical protein [Actinomycetales bacterium]